MSRLWSRILAGVVVIVFVVLPVILFVLKSPTGLAVKTRIFPGPTPNLVSVPRFAAVDKRMVAVPSGVVASYLLHGYAVQYSKDSRGVSVQFVLDGDPSYTHMTVTLLRNEGKYQLLTYISGFGQQFSQQLADEQTVEQALKDPKKLIEFHVAFEPKLADSVRAALDAVQSGSSRAVPTGFTVAADMLGIVQAK